jgi:hypothetical protein
MLETILVAAATAVVSVVAVWAIGIVLCLIFVRDVRRETSDTQRSAKTWRWRLGLVSIWPFWVPGILFWEAVRIIRRWWRRRRHS